MKPELRGFEFVRCLGSGRFGEVWLATDLNLKRACAAKLLHQDRFTPEGVEKLKQEAQVMASLSKHRNRVAIYSFHSSAPGYLIMEYVDGGSLSQQVSPQRQMSWERACRYVADVADGLLGVHEKGILHRDIKPQNILWNQQTDEVLIGDFGVAALPDRVNRTELTPAISCGTPGYMAPELLSGPASAKSDVFSLGATLFHLVTGRPPFDPINWYVSLCEAAVGIQHPVAALNVVPKSVEDVILSALEPDTSKRIDLHTFTDRLRGAHLQLQGDRLNQLSQRTASKVGLRVSVSTAREFNGPYQPVDCNTQNVEPTRDMDVVPEPAPRASVHTGDYVRLEVMVEVEGYITILNLGSSGRLNVLFPRPSLSDNRIYAGRCFQPVRVRLVPPPGTDRAVIIWTRQPDTLLPHEWRDRIDSGKLAASPPEEATRDMDFVLAEASHASDQDWAASVIEISHQLAS